MKFTLVHLWGSQRGKTENFDRDLIKLGTDPANDLVFDPEKEAAVAPFHAELFFDSQTCDFMLSAKGSPGGTFINNNQISEIILQDNDLIELGIGGPKLRFRVRPEDYAMCKPFREILSDSKDIAVHARRGKIVTTTLFLSQMLKDAAVESTRGVKIFMAVMLLLLVSAIAAIIYGNRIDKKEYENKITALKKTIESQDLTTRLLEKKIQEERQRFSSSIQTQSETVEALRKELAHKERDIRLGFSQSREQDLAEIGGLREKIKTLEKERSFAENIIRRFGSGVCFIQGSYGFIDKKTGRMLRFQGMDEEGSPLRGKDGNILLTLEGDGPLITVDYTGTGFLVDRKGLILTNRHLTEPWKKNELSQQFGKHGYEPKRTLFRAYFPHIKRPFNLTVVKVSERADVAALKIEPRGVKLPVLKLDYTGKGAIAGQPIVLVGYPAGLDVLLAKADDKTSDEILKATEAEGDRMAQELANRGLIRPMTTQGHLSDILPQQFVYDAPTTVGGSGAPIFNNKEEVIGINYAILKEFSGSNFGVPIKYGIELLR